jgi:hypothetical protein
MAAVLEEDKNKQRERLRPFLFTFHVPLQRKRLLEKETLVPPVGDRLLGEGAVGFAD